MKMKNKKGDTYEWLWILIPVIFLVIASLIIISAKYGGFDLVEHLRSIIRKI